ncbi:MAG: SDR family NAD(P)-dependent oxidoreductase [Cryomorphaceae bacterium]|nr:MAG: SDR family NAD(P)-dependent oxidoreductase [Cryomorphaceae bacterium]|tara:strand:+ start:336 stop:1025 length:690 start_codon:yes stop_codon:yes gene_type:complete
MKNILMIGGSYGIGLPLVKILNKDFNVYVACRTNDQLQSENINFIKFDALNDEFDNSLIPDEIHGFVYLPGSINLRPFKGLSIEAFKQDLEINLISLIKVLKTVMPKLMASNYSSIVLMSTVAVQRGMPFHSSVSASKGAIEGLTKSLAAEYAPKIRVNAVAPSIVDTPLANRFLNNDLKIEKSAQKHPLKRVGNSTDIAETINFLLSEKSSWMTGQVIGVDGGTSTLS